MLVHTFGDGEYVLRLFPFVAGILSLFLFYGVARRVLMSQPRLIIALGLFTISDPLLRYSSELKQYSSDVTVALCIFLMGLLWLERESRFILYTFLFSIIGSILIWFSHPSIFCLAGAGITLTVHSLKTKKWKQLVWLSVPALFWLSSFAINSYMSLLELSHPQSRLVRGWESAFMPMMPLSVHDLMWYPRHFFGVFAYPAGFYFSGIAAFCFVIGWTSKFFENRPQFYMLTLPVLVMLGASGLHKYPVTGRFVLFLVPIILIFIGEGVGKVIDQSKHIGPIAGVSLCVILFLHPVHQAVARFLNPIELEEIKPVMNYLTQNYQNGDVLYLYHSSWPAFEYYAKRYGFEGVERLVGVEARFNWPNYVKDLKSLNGNERVWILFSHLWNKGGVDEEKFFLFVLDGIGKQVDSFKREGASVYLYDLQ